MSVRSGSSDDRPRVLFVAPIVPAPEGNGLSMRAATTLQGLSKECNLTTLVLPVSDPGLDQKRLQWSAAQSDACALVPLSEPQEAARRWMKTPESRNLIGALQSLPDRARLAPPDAIAASLEDVEFDLVWIMRLYLAATVLPFRDQSARLILDIDEDDAAVLRSISNLQEKRGDVIAAEKLRNEAEAYDRLAARAFHWFDQIVTASPLETAALNRRHHFTKGTTIPNAVSLPAAPASSQKRTTIPKILFIGNFDYAPNLDAALRLTEQILPIIQESAPKAELHLVGGGQRIQQLRRNPSVVVHGYVTDLAPLYDSATLALVPLRAGGGSRLKILEAFSFGLPVVATPKGCEGLEVCDGEQLLVAETDSDLAAAALRLSSDGDLAERLVQNARRFVAEQHSFDVVSRKIAQLVFQKRQNSDSHRGQEAT